jgi:hypothetical protein
MLTGGAQVLGIASNNATDQGVMISGGGSHSIVGNSFQNLNWPITLTDGAKHCIVTGNTVFASATDVDPNPTLNEAIRLLAGAQENVVMGNTIRGKDSTDKYEVGIRVNSGCPRNTISGNRMDSSGTITTLYSISDNSTGIITEDTVQSGTRLILQGNDGSFPIVFRNSGGTVISKISSSGVYSTGPIDAISDADVLAWISNVETADSLALEASVKDLVNTAVVGIKTDGDWSLINTLVILNAARTLAGMAVAQKGTNLGTLNNIVIGDLVRGRGLAGNGVNRWANTNVLTGSFMTASSGFIGAQLSVWSAKSPVSAQTILASDTSVVDSCRLTIAGGDETPTSTVSVIGGRIASTTTALSPQIGGTGYGANFIASLTRTNGSTLRYSTYAPTATQVGTVASTGSSTTNANMHILAGGNGTTLFTQGNLAFYVFGTGSDTAAVDRIMTRLATLTAGLRSFFGN